MVKNITVADVLDVYNTYKKVEIVYDGNVLWNGRNKECTEYNDNEVFSIDVRNETLIINISKANSLLDKILKEITTDYPWGNVVDNIVIDDILIIHYKDRDDEKDRYSPYLLTDKWYRRMNFSYHTIKECIVGAIAMQYDGCNTRADGYFWKMIGKEN